MDFSNANVALWQPIVQIGIIAGLLLGANIIRRKITQFVFLCCKDTHIFISETYLMSIT